MKINWFTVIAQVINFVVLVWLLKRFLYKPILKAVDDREKKIASQINDANHLKEEAKKEQDDFIKKNADFDQQKKGLMDKAVADANTQRQKLLDQAKDESNKLSAKLEQASKEKQKTEQTENAQKTQKQVLTITRKALTEIASESLEEQSAGTFIKRLKESKDEEKKQFIEAFKSNANTILIKSAFDLPAKQQQDIAQTVNDVLGTKSTIQFKTTPGIISGIELSTNGYKLAWSFSEYLNSLEKNISETMNEKSNGKQENNVTAAWQGEPEKKKEPVKT